MSRARLQKSVDVISFALQNNPVWFIPYLAADDEGQRR